MKHLLFCLLGMFYSCGKENKTTEVHDIQIDIFVLDHSGINLLSKNNATPFDVDAIKLLYLINEDLITVNKATADCQRGFCLITDAGSERIRIFPNDAEGDALPVTYIDWGNGERDTIKCHFIRNVDGSSVVCDKVWFNEELVFPDKAVPDFGRAFQIIK